MPTLDPADEKEVKRLLQMGASGIARLEPFLARVEPELAQVLPEGHGLDSQGMRRFLIARNLVIDGANGAREMVEKHLDWRKATLPVAVTPEVKEELRKGKFFRAGEDAHGNPLIVVRSSRFDPKERDLDVAIKAAVHAVEESVAALPNGHGQFSVLYDRTDFSFWRNWDLPFLKGVASIFSNNYPERLHGAYLYPSGSVLPALWKMVSVFFDPRTQAKVTMIKHQSELLQHIPKEHLPKHLGGDADVSFDPSKYE